MKKDKDNNNDLEELLKNLKESYEEAVKLLKEKNNGGAFLLLAIPNISLEDYEKFCIGNKLEAVNAFGAKCNSKTLSALINAIKGDINRLYEKNPNILLIEQLGQIKSKMVIDEEDLNNES